MMPELVEVETTRSDLSKIIEGKIIRKVEVYLDKIVYFKKDEFIKKNRRPNRKQGKKKGKMAII